MPDNAIALDIGGVTVRTLRDILPDSPGLRALFIAKTPALKSVEAATISRGTRAKLSGDAFASTGS